MAWIYLGPSPSAGKILIEVGTEFVRGLRLGWRVTTGEDGLADAVTVSDDVGDG